MSVTNTAPSFVSASVGNVQIVVGGEILECPVSTRQYTKTDGVTNFLKFSTTLTSGTWTETFIYPEQIGADLVKTKKPMTEFLVGYYTPWLTAQIEGSLNFNPAVKMKTIEGKTISYLARNHGVLHGCEVYSYQYSQNSMIYYVPQVVASKFAIQAAKGRPVCLLKINSKSFAADQCAALIKAEAVLVDLLKASA